MSGRPIVLGISGASGAAYAVRLLEVLLAAGRDVHLTISHSATLVIREELNQEVDLKNFAPEQLLTAIGSSEHLTSSGAHECSMPANKLDLAAAPSRGKIHYHHYQNLMSSIASGSFLTAGMVICPCSGGTLGAIVHGTGENLIHRAAQVHLKERRKLILTPRETPLSIVQLENMKRAAEAGAIMLPAMPGFYHGARTIADLVDFIVARICDQLEVEHSLMRRWGT